MTCQHFTFVTDQDCRILLTCGYQQRLVPHGERLIMKCRSRMARKELEIGWCPKVL
ncbi:MULTISPECIES: galactose oxidase [unclassified Synechococcus]|uniref:galactose oxidase n=1 Tax=unclassified Synechococcus TaxID=2626047 RepID=UPI0039AF7149